MNDQQGWRHYREQARSFADIGLTVDASRMLVEARGVAGLEPAMASAFAAMEALERGERVNRSEDRMVGHYWLRAPELAPDDEVRGAIESAVAHVRRFAADVHTGVIAPERGDGFFVLLVIGIGGSALGAQWVCDALSRSDDPLIVRFVDNTDPVGIDRVLEEIGESLENTLTVVISKSGGTRETLNGMEEVSSAYAAAGLTFARHAVAITQDGSRLARRAADESWLEVFPMWDWVGGRTSVTSPVGLLPAALVGVDIDDFLRGAAACDVVTRSASIDANPAAILAVMWFLAGGGRGDRHMVVEAYRDQLLLLPRYLQQLVMESIGKASTRDGAAASQGLSVFGNKGSTDQHALVQQLRDGRNDFFALFVRVLASRERASLTLDHGATSADYLDAMWQGTRDALNERGRPTLTLTLDRLNAHRMGVLVALFERAVGLYGELVNVNAYDQPGVEAGKRAADAVIELQSQVLAHLRGLAGAARSADAIAAALNRPDDAERIYHVLRHAAANPDHGVTVVDAEAGPDTMFRVG